MAGFEPGPSGVGSDYSANCSTTAAQILYILLETLCLDHLFSHVRGVVNDDVTDL